MTPWHALAPDEVTRLLGVDPRWGLISDDAARRLAEHGLNRLEESTQEPLWRAFLRQFQDLLIIILLVAALVSLLVTRQWETPAAIAVVVLLNAVIGFVQESRAEASLEALRQLTVTTAAVRRDGRLLRLDAEELVPGDLVDIEAGDLVPADGRLLASASLEVQESSLTGEAHPVSKAAGGLIAADAPLAERTTAVFISSAVTRGRGTMVVTGTGMGTEAGRIADMLQDADPEPTPLQRQIDALSRSLAGIAGVVIGLVVLLGVVRGQDLIALFVTAVSLAVAAIPEGLPAVVAFTLAMGTARLAKQGAIVKRLASVETLGSTSHIYTDKTGTLTLNQMTARELLLAGRRFTVSGEGFSTHGRIRSTDGDPLPTSLNDVLLAMALCTDAVLGEGGVIGDPTDGALIVLAEKGGLDVAALRDERPRTTEIPFDSEHKFMATFHPWTDETGRNIVRCFIKGAPDVLARRADRYRGGEGILSFDEMARARYDDGNARLADQGMRVLGLGTADFPAEGFDASGDLIDHVERIVLLALVGIADPPRPEARKAIAQCRDAGIRVRMITGDHVVTAGAIASELGIPGEAITGAELDLVADDELADRLDDVGVVARVTAAHKIRMVRALQARGDVVAMTGDGVNDAPALRRADIGVAMGVTGTEVSKEAATMVLTDDNFSSIVSAVREGRGIYDNIVKFTRFQVSTALGFVLTFLVASVSGLAGGAPFTALQILFVNLVMDGPPAMSLGIDPVAHDAMNRPPRPVGERILTRTRLIRILLSSVVMAAGTLAVLMWAPGPDPRAGAASVAGTMAFVTFVFFQAFNLLNVRHDTRSTFSRETLENASAFVATAAVIVLLTLVVELDATSTFFSTTDLTSRQWLTCGAVGSIILWTGELVKVVLRHRARRIGLPGTIGRGAPGGPTAVADR
jgi:P-type Ca2+ transporter type 2C